MVDDNLTDNSYLYESSVAAIDFVSDKYEVCSAINSRSTPDPPFLDAFLASRERCFCVSISFLNSFESNLKPASSAMSSVKSMGNPSVSYRKNAFLPETVSLPSFFKSSSNSAKNLIPRSNIVENAFSSSCIISNTVSWFLTNSGNASPYVSTTIGTSVAKNPGSALSICCPYRVARRKIRRNTYPLPSLLGTAPSAIANVNARA
mmetsp:Transcript_9996/g.11128  ORF Transcript_9996/g.11128 Transcript_9996/m.11128 type:complete len:205 (-) Transcript_9996:1301-1915(-)